MSVSFNSTSFYIQFVRDDRIEKCRQENRFLIFWYWVCISLLLYFLCVLCKANWQNVLIVSIIGHSVVHIKSIWREFNYVVSLVCFATRLIHYTNFRMHSHRKPHFAPKIWNKINNGGKKALRTEKKTRSLSFQWRNFLTLAAMMIYETHSKTFVRPWWFTDMTFQVCSLVCCVLCFFAISFLMLWYLF